MREFVTQGRGAFACHRKASKLSVAAIQTCDPQLFQLICRHRAGAAPQPNALKHGRQRVTLVVPVEGGTGGTTVSHAVKTGIDCYCTQKSCTLNTLWRSISRVRVIAVYPCLCCVGNFCTASGYLLRNTKRSTLHATRIQSLTRPTSLSTRAQPGALRFIAKHCKVNYREYTQICPSERRRACAEITNSRAIDYKMKSRPK
jgi:hypothetical protein